MPPQPPTFVDVGVRLHVYEWPGQGTPFLLLHGLASNSRTWFEAAEYLAARGHRVVAYDQRGHGHSDKPSGGYDFPAFINDLKCLLEALAIHRPIIAGQSWGGNVVLEFAARLPGAARGIALVDGGFLDLHARPDGDWETIAQRLRPPNLLGTPRDHLKRRLLASHPDWSEAGIENTLANFETLPDDTVRPWLAFAHHMAILRALWEQSPAALYPLVRQPTLICAATRGDPQFLDIKREQVSRAQAGLRLAEVHWFDADHDIHVHRPHTLAELFLTTLSSGIWRTDDER